MIYVTGDCHADWTRFSRNSFPEQKEMTRDDYVIVCGDFGIWHDNEEERYWLNWLSEKNFTLLFVDGNHENFDRLNSDEFEVVDFHGGKAHKIRENIYHLIRGHVFELCGKKIFAFGGASSHDIDDGILDEADFENHYDFIKMVKIWRDRRKRFRINHLSWWKEELPSQEEMDFGEQSLSNVNYKVDYVITHCLPQEIASVASFRESDILTIYLNKLLYNGLKFDSWWAGHYHLNDRIMGKFNILYEDIVRIE